MYGGEGKKKREKEKKEKKKKTREKTRLQREEEEEERKFDLFESKPIISENDFSSGTICLFVRRTWTNDMDGGLIGDAAIRNDRPSWQFYALHVYLCVNVDATVRRSTRTLRLCMVIRAKNSPSLIERDNRYKLNIAVKWQQVR